MSIPVCPVHQRPMRAGRGGGFFCATKMPDGSWCPNKAKPDVPPVSGMAPPVGKVDSMIAAAALQFAAEFYRGADPQSADDALQLALRAYRTMGAA